MPFDATPLTKKEKLRRLIADLRGPLAGWEWDFMNYGHTSGCGTGGCAYARAVAIGLIAEAPEGVEKSEYIARELGLSYDRDAQFIFCAPLWYRENGYFSAEDYGWHSVTPAMVADALERYL